MKILTQETDISTKLLKEQLSRKWIKQIQKTCCGNSVLPGNIPERTQLGNKLFK